MNLFKSLLFLEGYLTDRRRIDDRFATGLGNKLASERAFRDRFSQPDFARPGSKPASGSARACGCA